MNEGSDEFDPTSYESSPTHARLIVVGGGRGGSGKSLIAVNLAAYLAQLGKTAILVDADPTGANLHVHFGLSAATHDPMAADAAESALSSALVQTNVPGLLLLPAAHDASALPVSLRAGRRGRWLSRLRGLSTEYLIIDVGPGYSPYVLDVLLAADFAIHMVVPEPAAVDGYYRLLRATYRRRLRQSLLRDRLRLGLFDRAMREIGRLPSPIEVLRASAKIDSRLAELAWAEAQRVRSLLVVNQTRTRSDLDLGGWMTALAARHYGLPVQELGHIEYDDAVWLTARRHRPLLVDSPTCKAARNIERIARRILAMSSSQHHAHQLTRDAAFDMSHYAVLGIPRTTSEEEVRRAFKRQKEVYALGSLATTSLLSPSKVSTIQATLQEAYDTLLDPVRRRAYDLSNFPEIVQTPQRPSEKPALSTEQLFSQAQLRREIGPDTDFSGLLLRRVREALGLELADIASQTKIGRAYLSALEEEDFSKLPAAVYVRGFLAQLAKCLELDPEQVQRTYMRRLKAEAKVASDE